MMNRQFVTNPAASAADDQQVEKTIDALSPDELFDLAAYAAAWDEINSEGQEEEHNRAALVRPALPWPAVVVAVVSIAVLILAWGA